MLDILERILASFWITVLGLMMLSIAIGLVRIVLALPFGLIGLIAFFGSWGIWFAYLGDA